MRRILLAFALTISSFGLLMSQTSLQGKVIDGDNMSTLPFVTIAIYKNGTPITGTESDFDGNYLFSNIDAGTYDIEATFIGYASSRVEGVVVNADKVNQLDFTLQEQGEMIETVIVTGYRVPLISIDETSTGGTITAESIKKLPSKNIAALAATTAGLSTVNGTDISVRGARSNSTYIYIDGVRVNGSINNLIPQSEIEQLQVVTGGIEAKYGDVTGGVISITSKGPSEAYSGGIELETSHFLDAYGYKLLSGNISGPLLKKTMADDSKKTILGFRLSGQYRDIDDDSPSFVGVNRVPEDVINDLESDPMFNIGETSFPRADTLTSYSNPETLKAAPNERNVDWNVSLKLDARLSDNIDVSLSGGYFDRVARFTPFSRTSRTPSRNGFWSLLNWNNNPYTNSSGYRGNLRFRHRLGNQSLDPGEANTSLIRNAYYTLQVGAEKNQSNTEDLNHGDNLFNYGYWGTTDRTWEPFASPNLGNPDDTLNVIVNGIPFAHQEYQANAGEFVPDLTINKTMALYNALSGEPQNGINDADYRDVWGIYHNVGQVYNVFFKNETDIYTVNVTSGFDLIPGSTDDGKHSIQFGFSYEQRVRRSYEMNPQALWNIARLAANRHISGVTDEVIGTFTQQGFGETEFPQFQTRITPEEFDDLYFFKRIREITEDDLNTRVNTDGLTPDQLSLDLFAPGELISDVNLDLNYYGYDYQGNKLDSGVTFDDFFTKTDDNGVRTFDVAPLQPVYAAGYIQDKFTFRDIIFRAGVRVDYFDANTKVLKDQYSLYEIEDASNWHAQNPEVSRPAGVGDDYKVYVKDDNPSEIQAYRDGDQWFFPNGGSVNNPNALFSGSIVTPVLKDEENRVLDITLPGFDPDVTFEDYTPQFNVMPRLAFSFPISDEAGFFAHYDVLVQRPPSNTESTALNYFYFSSNPNRFSSEFDVAGNPNLRPEKTIDYQVGFQQKLSNSSAIKVSAYYRELRDMIQRQIITNVPGVGSYETFGNIDFGTVKGFSFAYDLRRTGNLTMKANYTLQFANGSGSDANSGRGLNQNGVIRELFPFSYDERHRINITLDYRYGEGKGYTGPKIGGRDIFANTGANFIISTVSGRPYSLFSQIQDPYQETDIQNINGSRLPWIFNTDLRLDKQMSFNLNPEAKRSLNANIYLRFENLFNTRNVIDVYNVSQSADDDGYLISEFGLDQLNTVDITGRDVEGYLSSYQWRLLNPSHFAAPRRIYLGVIFDF